MGKLKLIALLLTICIESSAQNKDNPIIIGDSSLRNYLSNSLDTISVDSCFNGIYYIKFSLTENGEIIDYSCSNLLPAFFKQKIKKSLENLNGKWSLPFLQLVSNTKKTIVQPIFFQIDANCSLKDNFYSKKLNVDSPNYNCDIANSLVIIQADFLRTIDISFNKAHSFDSDENYLDCLLLKPCIVEGIKTRKKKGAALKN